ncbi:MAG: hypothetical protein ACLRVT_04830 [Oscillospiraceae bacterium]
MEKGATWETSVILILLLCLTAACIGLACHMVSYRTTGCGCALSESSAQEDGLRTM